MDKLQPANRFPADSRDSNASRVAVDTTFTAWYRSYVNPIYAYLCRRVGNQADAEDLAEQVFLEALENLEQYEERGKARAWLFTIAHSRLVDYYRQRKERLPFDEVLDSPMAGPGPEAMVAHREEMEHLSVLLDDLDADKRELLLLRFGGELTYAEIGEALGRSEAAVKMAIHRLLDQLRGRWHFALREEYNE